MYQLVYNYLKDFNMLTYFHDMAGKYYMCDTAYLKS